MKHTLALLALLAATVSFALTATAQDGANEGPEPIAVSDATDVQTEYLLDADDFDLEAVAGLVRDSQAESPTDLERFINEDNGINNVDVDGDGFVDHVIVREVRDEDAIRFEFIAVPSSRPNAIEDRVVVARMTFREVLDEREIDVVADYPEHVRYSEVYVYEYTVVHPYYVHHHHYPHLFFWWLYSPGRTVWVYSYDPWVHHTHHHVHHHHDLVTVRTSWRHHHHHRNIAATPRSHTRPPRHSPPREARPRYTPPVRVPDAPGAAPAPRPSARQASPATPDRRMARPIQKADGSTLRAPAAADARPVDNSGLRTRIDARKVRSLEGAPSAANAAPVAADARPVAADAPRTVRTPESSRPTRKASATTPATTKPGATQRAVRSRSYQDAQRARPTADTSAPDANSRAAASAKSSKAKSKGKSKAKAKARSRGKSSARKASRSGSRVRRMR